MATKPILVWGAVPSVATGAGFSAACESSGGNLGNILIGNAVHSVLSASPRANLSQFASPEEVSERCSMVVIAAANFLWRGFDLSDLADFVGRTSVPVVVIGVGAQAADRSRIAPVHPGTLRLMKIASERSASIGVRGHYSAEVLAAHGIHNIEVIGCPSIYASGTPAIHVDAGRCANGPTRIGVSFSRRVHQHAFCPIRMRSVENAVMSLALSSDATFIAQDEREECDLSESARPLSKAVSSYFGDHSQDDLARLFRNSTRWFGTVQAWSECARNLDVVVGSRLHGAIMALRSGTPAMLLVHDSRTLEIAALTGVPYLHILSDQVRDLRAAGLRRVLQELSFSQFEHSYKSLYQRYRSFLTANGLPHNLPSA